MRVQVHAADLGGCGHYRAIWPATAVHYNDAADVDIRTADDGGGAAFELRVDPAATARARRAVVTDHLAAEVDADVVVIQRPLTANLVTVIRALQRAGVAVVVEVDDDFERIDPRNTAWPTVQPVNEAVTGRNWRHLATACELADLVTVTTPRLAEVYGRHGRVRVIPNYIPTGYLHIEPPAREPGDAGLVRLGWSGNIDTHPNDLPVTRGAVGRVCREHDIPFHVIGDNDARLVRHLGLSPGTKVASTGGWLPLAKYPVGMSLLDVGIVPLDLTPFNEAKSWLKGLEFAAVGVAFAASPTAEYRRLAELGAGVLVERPKDWLRHLRRLVADDDYRAEVAQAGKRAASKLTVEEHLDEWVDAWQLALDNAAARKVSA
jgi:hypothetical protein